MEKVRWGLLSTARINRRLIPAIRASKRGELVAVASRNLETAKAYANEWKIPLAYGSYEEMLTSGKVDAVYISLPNHLHAEWSIRAVQAGCHVLCEKPLALSTQEVRQMMAASQQTGKTIAEAFMYRHHPQTRIAKEWVESGRLGEVTSAYGAFTFALEERQNVRLVPEYGGGALWDVGVYPMSFAQYLFGSAPEWVAGAQWLGETGVDETFAGLMVYPGNRLVTFTCGFRSPWYTRFEIVGTKGRLDLSRPFAGMDEERRMIFYSEKGKPVEMPVPKVELYLGEVEDLHAVILDGALPALNLLESLEHIRTVQALYQSARSGQIVRLQTIE